MDSSTRILDIAERRMRQAGYNAVSYRDIAAEMGIKSASLHYHFPKKTDMGTALVKRYAERFETALYAATADITDPKVKLSEFVGLYRYAMEDQRLVCLCAVLGAEAPGLPDPIVAEVKVFFDTNMAWLEQVFTQAGATDPMPKAKTTLSTLGGAMIVGSVTNDADVFEAAVKSVLDWK